jgi:hypothetical protein
MNGCASIRPTQLRCEYRENPLGIDTETPRLSWVPESDERGQNQTAYHVLVASVSDVLARDQGDLWDSMKVASNETIQIQYRGSRLGLGQPCWWKVRVWDRQDQPSAWSDPATWTMGLFDSSGGNAKWIGPVPNKAAMADNPGRSECPPESWFKWKAGLAASGEKPEPLPLLRREFDVPKPIRRALVSVCGLGHYELRLNGTKVGDHILDPGWTNYRKTCLYSTYDVTGGIQPGKNCLGAMLGNGMFHERGIRFFKFVGSFGSPQMILRLRLDFTDGTASDLVSDSAWRIAPGPITFSSIFGGEDYDARLESPGWDKGGFDDSDWQHVTVVDGPGGNLAAQSAPPIKVIETFLPIGVTEPTPGVFVYDLGQNFSGRPNISLQGPAGATVQIIPSEVLDEKGLVDSRGWGCAAGERLHLSYYTYTLKGEGIETWHPQFSYYGFRYLQVEGAAPRNKAGGNVPVVLGIEGQFTRSSASRAGSFACSNDLMNRIHRLVDWGIASNLQSIVTDCPQREKLGWLEIAHLTAPSAMYNYDLPALYAKIARDTTEAQQPNGLVPTTAPEYSVFSNEFRDTPEWGSAVVIIPWLLYQWYGDTRVLAESFPAMKQYVDYLSSRAKDHIISFGLGDWGDFPSVEEHMGWAQMTPLSVTGTTIYYYDTIILSRVAALLEKTDEARQYTAQAETIRKAFNHALFNPEANLYAYGTKVVPHELRHDYNRALFDPVTNQYVGGSQASQAMPLVLGMVEPDRVEAVFANLVSIVQKHKYVTAGDVGHRFLLLALAEHGRSDLVFELHSRTTGFGYGFQIAQGLTALGEAWDGRSCASMNHGMLGHIQEWFHAYILGIQAAPDAVAFNRIVIRPQIVGDLTWARGHYDSIRGNIAVDWQIKAGQLILKVTIPANTSAAVYVPTTDPANVFESGKPANQTQGVTQVGKSNGTAVYHVESGNYIFTAPLQI